MNLRATCLSGKFTVRVSSNCLLTFVFVVSATAQWTVVNLHPSGATYSQALAVRDGKQVGWADYGNTRASMWSGDAASWVDLNPVGSIESVANAVEDGKQVGQANVGGIDGACIWNGSASPWVDLNPTGTGYSEAFGIDGERQIGAAYATAWHAGYWNGTAASWTDLNPTGAIYSFAQKGDQGYQVGWANVAGASHASLWNGTAFSWVDLNPIGATESFAYDIHRGQQVGYCNITGVQRASLWLGSASSLIDLHPVGASNSKAWGVFEGQQVGSADIGGSDHACIWNGTAISKIDLHNVLPSGYSNSYARGIWKDASFTYVVGWGIKSTTGRYEALMWIRPNTVYVQPTSYNVLRGLDFGGNLGSILNSDNQKVYVLCDDFDSNGEIQFGSTLPAGTVSQLKFKFEGAASRNDLSQFVRMFNFSTNAYTNVSFQSTTIVDSVVEGTITTGVANYYSGTREVRSRVFWVPQADVDAADGWIQSCDQVLWTMN